MNARRRRKSPVPADQIAKLADQGKDVSRFFTSRGKMMPAIQPVTVDFTADMLEGVDRVATGLDISRQAVIRAFVRQGLDQRHLADQAKKAG